MSEALEKNKRFAEAVARRALKASEAVLLPVKTLDATPPKRAYVTFSRDSWGIVRWGLTVHLTEAEAAAQSDFMRQCRHGWLVPAEEAKDQR